MTTATASLIATEERTSRSTVRVCHVSLMLQTGGLERLLVDFARFHDRSRFDVRFAVMGESGQPAEDIREAGCAVHELRSTAKGRWQRIRHLADFLRSQQIDVVHTHNAYPHLYATIAARLARIPVVVHTRHGRRFGERWHERLQFGLSGRLADRVVAVSDDTAALCRNRGWLPESRVDRIWNGIDIDRFPYRGPASDAVGICVARLSKEKDVATLLRAASFVRQDIPTFRLVIVGDGPERTALEHLARELDITEVVEFTGERSDVPELLQTAAFFISSSTTEGISLTLLEAMAVGLPVVATEVGGNPEIVVPGRTGLLVPPSNESALASAIRDLCHRPDTWRAFGVAGRSRVEECFTIQGMVDEYEQLYLSLLSSRT